ncbi:hypothetical protein OROMI_018387 [Orobanche minor]
MLPRSTAADLQSGKMGASTSTEAFRCANAFTEFCCMRPKKRLKGDDDDMAVKDRISNLPNCLLDEILSSLPTKNAVATSVLSRRWRRAFTWLTRLEFDDSPISHCVGCPHLIDSFTSFKMFVDNVLQACQSKQLTTFRLYFGKGKNKCRMSGCDEGCYPIMKSMHVNAWISFPLTRGVRELDIYIRVREPDKLSSAIFDCRTLEVLRLDMNLDLEVPSSTNLCLPNLKEFHLTVVHFPDDDSVTRLVSSCTSLEYLALEGSSKPVVPVCIYAPSLRRLAIQILPSCERPRCKVVLDVPNLEYLAYDDTFALCYSIGDLNSLVEAQVDTDFTYTDEKQIVNILSLVSPLSNVRRLFLMQGCIEVLSLIPFIHPSALDSYELEYKLPIFRNLNHLQLGSGYYEWNKILLELLNCAPFLETLAFPEGIAYEFDEEEEVYMRVSEKECQSWSKTQVIPSCLGFHLKRISIKSYARTHWELEMVKYFLRNTLVLEELMVVCDTSVPLADRILLDSTLQKLPRGSMACSIEVQ